MFNFLVGLLALFGIALVLQLIENGNYSMFGRNWIENLFGSMALVGFSLFFVMLLTVPLLWSASDKGSF